MAPARDRRTGFSRRRQYSVFLGYVFAVAGAVVGAVLLVVSRFNPPAFATLRMTTASVTAPVSSVLVSAVDVVESIPRTVSTYFFVHQENKALHLQLDQTRAVLRRAQTIIHDNRRLRTLLAIRDRSPDTVVTARLVSSSGSSGRRFAVLNAGAFQGVRPGMPVRGPDGLVGRIIETGPVAARVLLLSDAESVVPVQRTRDGMPAIAAGRGDGHVDIRSVDQTNVRFNIGDLFVTSGIGGLYAPGIPVARIAKAGRDTVAASTFANPDTLDFAIVSQPFLPMPAPFPAPGTDAP